MTSALKSSLIRAGLVLVNGCGSRILGRKLITVDQRNLWQQRAHNWRDEVVGAEQDLYYAGPDRRSLEALAELSGSERFLGVGCFFGQRLAKVQGALSDALVVGVDMASDALYAAREAQVDGGELRLVGGDATQLPFRSDAVDCVYTCVCLTHIPERLVGTAIEEMLRVTRQYLVLAEVYEHLMGFLKKLHVRGWRAGYCHAYEELLDRPGLIRERVEGIYDDSGHPRYTLFVYNKGVS